MAKLKDEKWLKKILTDCFSDASGKAIDDEKLLEGFSMLLRHMLRNMENNLKELRALWEKDPRSETLREKFDSLAKCLFYLDRFCQEKIEKKNIN